MEPDVIFISTPDITLGQFLKFANIVAVGADAKFLIQNGHVSVNGAVETRRGHKLKPGDQVDIAYEDDWFCLQVGTQ